MFAAVVLTLHRGLTQTLEQKTYLYHLVTDISGITFVACGFTAKRLLSLAVPNRTDLHFGHSAASAAADSTLKQNLNC